ncbi:MAG: T9SS type A sorting domain-containing protein [Bacteroidota bacterium]
MKKYIFLLAAFNVIAITLNAQIPNFSFENWTNMGTYENPDSWGTLNNATTMAGVYTVTKGTPGNPGSSYMKITSKTIGTGVVGGIAVSGQLDSITMQPKSGFPFTLRPISFTGKWQHMIYGSSQGSLTVFLTRWNTSINNRDTIAIASQTLSGMAMSWANFTINFSYSDTTNPDTCVIVLRASGNNPTNNDYLWVDNLAFSGTVSTNDLYQDEILISVSPNPATENIFVSSANGIIFQSFSVYDVKGSQIRSAELKNVSQFSLDLSALPKGEYFLKIKTETGWITKKFIKN